METDIGQPTILIPVSMNLNVWYMHHSLRHTRRNIRASARRKIDGGLLFSTYDTLCNANLSGRWAILYLPGRCMSYLSLFLILFLIHGPRTPSVLNNKPLKVHYAMCWEPISHAATYQPCRDLSAMSLSLSAIAAMPALGAARHIQLLHRIASYIAA